MKKKLRFKHAAISTFIGLTVAGMGIGAPAAFVYAEPSADDVSVQKDTSDNSGQDNTAGQAAAFEVSDIIFSPETASPGDTVTVRVLTNLSKHHISSLTLEIPVNDEKSENVHLVHGENDILEGSFTIGDNWSNGSHTVSGLKVTATDQSVSDYDLSDTDTGSFTVEGSHEDYDAPVVSAVTLDKSEVRVGEAVTISVDVTHASDIEELIVTFADEGNVSHSVSFENGAKVHTKDLSGWDEGVYRVTGIFVRDKAGNREYYEENDNLDEVDTPTLTISNAYADTQGPLVTSVTFDKSEVSPGDYVTITALAHDSTGISYITVETANRNDERTTYYLFDDGEGNFTTEISIDETFLNGEYRITRIAGEDTLGNDSEFEPGDDTKDLEVNTFLVSGSTEDRLAPQLSGIEMSGSRIRPGETCSIRFRLTDENDITDARIGLYPENTNEAFKVIEAVLQDDGSYRCEFTADNQWFNGNYDIRISTSDNLSNEANHETGLQVNVYDSAEDYEAPELISLNVEKDELRPGDVLVMTAEVSDASRIDYVEASFTIDGIFATGPDGEEKIYTFHRDSDGLYKAYVTITDRFLNGDYDILMHLIDEWDNYEYDIESGVTFSVSGSMEDQDGPVITSALFDRESAVPGDEFAINVEAEDPSGIEYITVHIGPITDEYHAKYNPHLFVTLYPDEDGHFSATDLVDNAWENASYDIDYIEAADELGNIIQYMEPSQFDEEEPYEYDDITQIQRNLLTVTGSTLKDTELHVAEITFDKDEVNIGDTMNVSAKVTGEGSVKEIRLQLIDDHHDQLVWGHEVILAPDEDGNITGSFRINPADTYWRKGVSYGIAAIHLLDSDNSSRYYGENVDAEAMDDLRNVVFNRFTVDTYSDPVIEPADYTKVDAAIEKVPENLKNYTEDSVKELQAALDSVIRNKTEREQLVVNSYATAILSAINNLELKPADYSGVDEAVASVPEDLDIYTGESVKVLNAALDAVVKEKDITHQEEVDGFAADINAAVHALELKPADYTRVLEAKKAVPDDLSKYTDESVAALQKVLDSVSMDKKITQQAIVDGYAEEILAAVKALEEKSKPADEPTDQAKETPVKEEKPAETKKASVTTAASAPAATAATAPVIASKTAQVTTVASAPAAGDKSSAPLWIAALLSVTGITAAAVALKRKKD